MITSPRQYHVTQARVATFRADLERLRQDAEQGDDVAQVMAAAVEGKLKDLLSELQDYDYERAARIGATVNHYHGVIFDGDTDEVVWKCEHKHRTIDDASDCAKQKKQSDLDALQQQLEQFEQPDEKP